MRHVTRLTLAAIAAISLSGCASDRLASVERENLELRQRLAVETSRQMREIGLYAAVYAQSNNNTFPAKPSDLRAILENSGEDWSLFLSPYDHTPRIVSEVQTLEDPWAWIDSNSSFVFTEAELGDGSGVLLSERDPIVPGLRYTLFGDIHVEAVKLQSGS